MIHGLIIWKKILMFKRNCRKDAKSGCHASSLLRPIPLSLVDYLFQESLYLATSQLRFKYYYKLLNFVKFDRVKIYILKKTIIEDLNLILYNLKLSKSHNSI